MMAALARPGRREKMPSFGGLSLGGYMSLAFYRAAFPTGCARS